VLGKSGLESSFRAYCADCKACELHTPLGHSFPHVVPSTIKEPAMTVLEAAKVSALCNKCGNLDHFVRPSPNRGTGSNGRERGGSVDNVRAYT